MNITARTIIYIFYSSLERQSQKSKARGLPGLMGKTVEVTGYCERTVCRVRKRMIEPPTKRYKQERKRIGKYVWEPGPEQLCYKVSRTLSTPYPQILKTRSTSQTNAFVLVF